MLLTWCIIIFFSNKIKDFYKNAANSVQSTRYFYNKKADTYGTLTVLVFWAPSTMMKGQYTLGL